MQPAPKRPCCLVLAAGSSKRFGSDKRLSVLPDGRTLLQATLDSIPDLFARSLVVLHAGDDALGACIPPRFDTLLAGQADRGMGHSLKAGLEALAPLEGPGVLVVLGDMPWVGEDTYRQLARRMHPETLVVPRCDGRRGNPVGIGSVFLGELAEPAGDRGARGLLETHADAIAWLETEDRGVLRDVDTPEQLGPA